MDFVTELTKAFASNQIEWTNFLVWDDTCSKEGYACGPGNLNCCEGLHCFEETTCRVDGTCSKEGESCGSTGEGLECCEGF